MPGTLRDASAALAFVFAFALAAKAMDRAPDTLNLSYDAEAYRAWPVAFTVRANGSRPFPPQAVRCCLGQKGAPGGSGASVITVVDPDGSGRIVLDVVWMEFHSEDTFEARLSFSVSDVAGWTGGTVLVTLSFRPGGEVVLITDGPELAATRPSAGTRIETGEDMRALLTAPGLGRPHVREDYVELQALCGDRLLAPPDVFASRRALFSQAARAAIMGERTLPLPPTACDEPQ